MKVALAPEYLAFVRQLRREQTDAEKLLWYSLRNRYRCSENELEIQDWRP